SRSSTGTTRRSSSATVTPLEPGRVDSPPTSTIAAPSSTILRAAAAATSASRCTPPSEKESGVTLITPITDGRGKRSSMELTAPRISATRFQVASQPGCRFASALRGIRRGTLHRRAGKRERPRARLALALRLLLRLRLLDGLLLREHGRLVLAGEQALELIAVDRLALDQDLRDLVQLVHVLAQDGERKLVRLLDHTADLVVDLARDLLGVVGLGAVVAAEERLVVAAAQHAGAELLAHAEAHDHLLRRRGDPFEVVRGAGRDLVEDDLLRRAPAERHRHLVHQRRARRQIAVLGRQRDRQAERLAARHDRDLVHGVGVLEEVPDQRVAHLVVRGDL